MRASATDAQRVRFRDNDPHFSTQDRDVKCNTRVKKKKNRTRHVPAEREEERQPTLSSLPTRITKNKIRRSRPAFPSEPLTPASRAAGQKTPSQRSRRSQNGAKQKKNETTTLAFHLVPSLRHAVRRRGVVQVQELEQPQLRPRRASRGVPLQPAPQARVLLRAGGFLLLDGVASTVCRETKNGRERKGGGGGKESNNML